MAFVFTTGFSTDPGPWAKRSRTSVKHALGYAEFRRAGWFTIFLRGMLCNWMVSMGVVGAMISTSVRRQRTPCGCRSCCSSSWASSTRW
ncbi:hypothetical protein [Stutzerimonas xanthomarina]|uniref:hypothetical protein n=1 Tax=Stutzerimonas xanthomarina TaxID=271420 RepID=UPI003AA8EF35